MRCRPYLVIAAAWALYFHPLLLNPTHTLYAPFSDFLAEHLPGRIFLTREWHATGELPLWNPYHFCGSPFVHDIQAGVFYPPYAVTYLLPETATGAAMSWVVALHLLLAGCGALAYARSHGLGEAGALVAAGGFMFAGKWTTHLFLAGHTVTVGLAWLPFLLLALERRGVGAALGGGAVLALMILGTHPQWTFYAGVFAAVWTAPRDRAALRGWLLTGAGVVVLGVALAAVQLLPTIEAGRLSARAVGLTSSEAVGVGVYTLFGLIGPAASYDPPFMWEARGLLGLFLLAAAAAAPALDPGRSRYRAWVLVGLIAFACGGAVLIDWLPGFNVFRVPSRVLLVAAFPLAFLAGVTADALARSGWAEEPLRVFRRRAFVVVVLVAASSLSCVAVGLFQHPGRPVWGVFVVYWIAVGLMIPVVLGVVPIAPRARTFAFAACLIAESVIGTAIPIAVKPQADIYPPSGAVEFVAGRLGPGGGRAMDWDMGSGPHDRMAAFGGGSPLALVRGVESPRGYNPLDVRHYRQFIGYAIGDPTPVLGLSPVAQPVLPNFVVGHPKLFDLLNVRFLVAAAAHDPGAGWTAVTRDPAPPVVPALPPNPPPHLPPHVVYERASAFPRAWVVPEARAMPAGGEFDVLVAADLRRVVLVATDRPLPPPATTTPTARVVEYRPNRVRVALDGDGDGGGWLVLADVWYPGWTSRIDGADVPVERANHAFRGVPLPAGAREVEFRFEPRSCRFGGWISVVAVALLFVATPVVLYRARERA